MPKSGLSPLLNIRHFWEGIVWIRLHLYYSSFSEGIYKSVFWSECSARDKLRQG
jgi:hypothetical protein